LRMGQMGGSSNSTEYIDIAKPNFFFWKIIPTKWKEVHV
jgi:hypothetical protein